MFQVWITVFSFSLQIEIKSLKVHLQFIIYLNKYNFIHICNSILEHLATSNIKFLFKVAKYAPQSLHKINILGVSVKN